MNILPAGSKIPALEGGAGAVHSGPAPELTDEAVLDLAKEIARWIRSGYAKGLMIQRTRADLPNMGLDEGRGLYYVEIQNDGCTADHTEGDDVAEVLRSLIDSYDDSDDDPGFYLTPNAPVDRASPIRLNGGRT